MKRIERQTNKKHFTQKGGHLKMLAYVARVMDGDQKNWRRSLFDFREKL